MFSVLVDQIVVGGEASPDVLTDLLVKICDERRVAAVKMAAALSGKWPDAKLCHRRETVSRLLFDQTLMVFGSALHCSIWRGRVAVHFGKEYLIFKCQTNDILGGNGFLRLLAMPRSAPGIRGYAARCRETIGAIPTLIQCCPPML